MVEKNQIVAMLEGYAALEHFPSRFILTRGRIWTPAPLPGAFRRGQGGQCYSNAAKLALKRPELTYVEGYASHNGRFPLQHAWVVDFKGWVVDPTWEKPASSQYFGVPFATSFVRKRLAETGIFGLFDSPDLWLTFARGDEREVTEALSTSNSR
jgi:hypothetical protein